MKIIGIEKYGSPDVLQFMDAPKPTPGDHDLLVNVKAFAVNPVDFKVRNGSLAPSEKVENPPKILGWDAAGVVDEVGKQVKMFKKGDEVIFSGSIIRQGCYAEYCLVDERIVGHKPKQLSWAQSAAIPLCALTAWEAIIEQMCVQPEPEKNKNKSILIINGAGGVGSIAIQVAKKVCGLCVIATAGREETNKFCKEMGADHVINHREDLVEQVKKIKELDGGVNYVFNCFDGEKYFLTIANLLKPLGKACYIAMGGKPHENFQFGTYFVKRNTITFENMFCRSTFGIEMEKQGEILNKVGKLHDEKVFKSTLTKTLKASEIKEAHKILESGKAIGKIALEW